MRKLKTIIEVVNLLSSVAGITSISLLWMREKIHISAEMILATILVISLLLALTAIIGSVSVDVISKAALKVHLRIALAVFALAAGISMLWIAIMIRAYPFESGGHKLLSGKPW